MLGTFDTTFDSTFDGFVTSPAASSFGTASGLGLFTLGAVSLVAGAQATADAPPSDIANLANYIDPRTGDYVVADDGSFQRMPLVRHRVLMLLRTVRGSAAHEPDIGLSLPIRMDRTFEQRVTGSVLFALEPIGSDIRIDDVIVQRTAMGRADITVVYTDLTTGNSDTVRI